MVQSARVQSIVKGDDVVLTHQIMKDVAYNAELTRAPVLVNSQDVVRFFYPLADSTVTDLIGYVGTPIGSYPTSEFNVAIPGVIIDPLAVAPNRGTSTFQSGLGKTVRAEITRFVASFTANLTTALNVISNVSSFTNLSIGQSLSGPGIPLNTVIIALDSVGMTITMSAAATASSVGTSIVAGKKETEYSIDEVDIFARGFPSSLDDTSGGVNPPSSPLDLD